MATIKLQTLTEQPGKTTKGFTYSDLHLDFTPIYGVAPFGAYTQNNELLREREIIDVVADHDLAAIKNSIYNLFTTIPGQKILNPYFGLNLMQYVFEACTEDLASLIGNQIVTGVATFEPRITLKRVQVLADPNNQQYVINLIISVPAIGNSSFQLNGTLSTSGFVFLS